jgi:L-threonylcarbamoyladenylate synthase
VLALIDAAGFPITATSANRSGAADCRSAGEVSQQLDGRIPIIVDGGPSPRALPSTLLDLTSPTPRILRPGAIPEAELQPLLHG